MTQGLLQKTLLKKGHKTEMNRHAKLPQRLTKASKDTKYQKNRMQADMQNDQRCKIFTAITAVDRQKHEQRELPNYRMTRDSITELHRDITRPQEKKRKTSN